MDRCFSCFGNKYIAGCADDIAEVQSMFHYVFPEGFIFIRTKLITLYIKLYNAFTILDFYEKYFAFIIDTDNAAGNTYLTECFLLLFCKISLDVGGIVGYRVERGRIGVYSCFLKSGKFFSAYNFLFAKCSLHISYRKMF